MGKLGHGVYTGRTLCEGAETGVSLPQGTPKTTRGAPDAGEGRKRTLPRSPGRSRSSRHSGFDYLHVMPFVIVIIYSLLVSFGLCSLILHLLPSSVLCGGVSPPMARRWALSHPFWVFLVFAVGTTTCPLPLAFLSAETTLSSGTVIPPPALGCILYALHFTHQRETETRGAPSLSKLPLHTGTVYLYGVRSPASGDHRGRCPARTALSM